MSRTPIAVANGQRRIGEQLATWRRLRSLTAAQVADRAGVSRHTVMRLENGEGASLESMLRIARALGVLDSLVAALDPYSTEVGRMRSEEALPERVRPPKAGESREATSRSMSRSAMRTSGGRMYSHRRRGSESASFVYDDRFLANPDAYALDPALPLVTGTLQTPVGHALFGAFADTLPDRWGRTLIHRTERARAKVTGNGAALDGRGRPAAGRARRPAPGSAALPAR